MRILTTIFSALILAVTGCNAKNNPSNMATPDKNTSATSTKAAGDILVEFNTTAGDITLRLFGDTPKHRDNFVKLVNEGFYNGLLFHRVIKDFMVQTGDPDSKDAPKGKRLGMGDPGYTIEAEILCPKHFNKRGALAAARTGDNVNPERRSSGSQFYIVTGRQYNQAELDRMSHQMKMQQMQQIFDSLAREQRDSIMTLRRNRDQAGLAALQDKLVQQTEDIAAKRPDMGFSAEQIEAYKTVGGAPHLDGAYTVFGEVVKGLDVVDKIQNVDTDSDDRPLDDVKIIKAKVIEQ